MLDHSPSLDRVFQALSDPSRRAIVERLTRGGASVSELAQPLAMSLAAVVQHVQTLEASGLIRTRKIGRVRACELDRQVLASAEQWFAQRRALWEGHLDRLGQVLAEQAAAGDAVTEATVATSAAKPPATPAAADDSRPVPDARAAPDDPSPGAPARQPVPSVPCVSVRTRIPRLQRKPR